MDEIAISRYIGLAIRAGATIYGLDNIKKSLKNVKVIIYCHTSSTNLEKSLLRLSENSRVEVIKLEENSLDNLIHTTNCKAIGITNPHLADQIILLK
jgi:ribosomal protein L7Ae-like RNA K-turn-binding protein